MAHRINGLHCFRIAAPGGSMTNVSGQFCFDGFVVCADERQMLVDGKAVKLGARAFDLLMTLIERRDRVVGKDELLEVVWPGVIVEENTLQVHVSTLRKLLGPQIIATVPGRGYRFTARPNSGEAQVPEASLFSPVKARPGNLPEALPALYGREQDLKELQKLVQVQRLVTLVGAGGIGKTRLAQAAAHTLRDQWRDGAWMVELAPVTDPLLVPAAVAQALGARLSGQEGGTVELAQLLRGKILLLVLDNCEHAVAAVARLAVEVLAQAAGIRILATSQEPLHVVDEHQFRVLPLAVPHETSVEYAQDFGALALFEARARALDARFQLNPSNLAAAIEICRRLDGLALAIELAAARVPLLGVEGVRNRLDDRFRVLTAGARTAVPRHQALRAIYEWSYALLDAHEQTVMRRLGVFVGSFGLESAQHVAADGNIDSWAVLDHLGALVDKSLVVAEPTREPRYRLLETGRAWAIEKLAEAGEVEALLRRHAQVTLALFERSDEQRNTPLSGRLQHYLPDIDNLRAALDWARGPTGDADLQISLAGASAWLFSSMGQRADAVRRCEDAMARVAPLTPPLAEARLLSAWLRLTFPRTGAAERAAFSRAVGLYRAHGDPQRLAVALAEYGVYLAVDRDFVLAERVLDEADAICHPSWPGTLRLSTMRGRGWLLGMQGRQDEALLVVEKGLALAKALNDRYLIIRVLVGLTRAEIAFGQLERAVAHGREAVALVHSEGFVGKIGWYALGQLCTALTLLGHLDEALALAREIMPQLALSYGVVDLLDIFALIAFKRGHIAEAARAVGRADGQILLRNERRRDFERISRDVLADGLRESLPAADLERLLTEGAALSDDEAARLALAD